METHSQNDLQISPFRFPHSLYIIQDRYAKQHGWELEDISLCSSGNIAVSGQREYTNQSYVCIYGSTVDNSDSRDKPTLLYHRKFTDERPWLPWRRRNSFIKPNSTEIVTCRDDEVQVIDYNRDVVLRSRKVDGRTMCLSVSESQIFIGLYESGIVNIYDNDLNRIKSIRLKGIRGDRPYDIAAAADRLYVCTSYPGRAIVYSQDSGSILTEYTTGQDRGNASLSIAVNIQYQIVAVLWRWKQVAVYSINSNNCLVVFDVESGVSRIRISDQGRIVTGNISTGEVKMYDLGDFVYNLSAKLAQLMSSDEIKELRNHFNILDTEKDQSPEYSEVTLKTKNVQKVLTILKGRGILYPNKANELKTLFDNLGSLATSQLSGPIRLYEKVTNIHGDMPHDQPTVNAGRLNESFSVSPTHEIPEGRFPKQDNWQNLNLINVVNTTHGLVCYIRSGKKREPNVLTQLFKLPSLDSIDNPQEIYSKVISRQGYNKLSLAFIDETHLVMCYNKTLQIIDINSKEVVRGHQLRAAARTMDVEAGEIFVGVGNSSVVLVFNQNLEEITKLTFTLKDWKYPADMKVTSKRLFIICKVKPRDYSRSYNLSDRAMSFKRVDGEMEANFTFPGEQYTEPVSIAAHKESEFVGVLWSKIQHSVTTCMVSLHTLSGCCVFVFDGEHSDRIQILNKNTVILINQTDGLKFYNMAHFITINLLAIRLSYSIALPEYEGLQNLFGISDDKINAKDSGSSHVEKLTKVQRSFLHLFKILEKRDLVGPNKFDDFIAADAKVRASLLWSHVEAYWKQLAETGLTQSVSLEAGPSKQDDVPVTQEGGAENRASVSQGKEATAQLHSLYPGRSYPFARGFTPLQPQQQHHQHGPQQAKLQAQQHDQEHAAAYQQEQVAQQQPVVTLEQQAQQHDQELAAAFQQEQLAQQQPAVTLEQEAHADQQALRQQSLLHQQQLYQQQWQRNQAFHEQLQVRQEGLGYSQVQQYQQPVDDRHLLGFNQLQTAFAQKPHFQQFLNRPTAFHRQQLPPMYNQQQAAYNTQLYSQLPGGSGYVQHQQEQYTALPSQRHHEQQIQQQELKQQYPRYQTQASFQHQAVAPSHVQLGHHAYSEHMTGRQRIISPSSSQHHQQELEYQAVAGPLPVIEGSTVKDKKSLFVECLKEKLISLSQTNIFTPWEISFRWKSTDLFVSCWLILNDRKPMASGKNIEDHCKLKYIEIFIHDRLKPETRIIIEGGPGTGKTMVLAQLALDWCQGKIENVDILIFLPLKSVKDKTLIQAIKEFYIPENTPLSGNDIAGIFESDKEKICLLLDGLEEYSIGGEIRPKESSEVMKVLKKEKYPNCNVVVTCLSYFMHDLSDVPLLRIGQFGETERKSFIQKLSLDNIKKEEKMKQVIEDDSFLLSLCSIPLLFALAVHNIELMNFAEDIHVDKVAPFMKNMVETLWISSMSGHETWSEKELVILGELAFNGLCKSQQQFSWPKDFIETKISRLKKWLDCGILVLEKHMRVHPGTEFQDISQDYERHGRDEMEHVTGKTGTSQSLAQAETQHQKEDRQGRETLSNEATVRIRFLHEIIQEWFAATYLCSMMNYYTDEDQFHEYVISQLSELNPKDVHYVLRFTSYLHPRSCHAIINYLLTNFFSDDGSIESDVMDCICLCFAEHNDIKGTDIKNSVTEVCKEIITIDFDDGRLLQRTKTSLLQYASDCGVIIEEVQLGNVISAVDETSLTLNSGTKLGQLNTLQVIEVSQWDQVFHQDDFANILKLLSKGNSIQTILCHFPCHPPKILDEVIIENAISKNLEVEWNNGEVIWTLDPKKQIFIPMFGTMTKASQIQLKNKEDDLVSYEHFLMSLPGTNSSPFGKWPTKRPLSKTPYSDMKLDIAAKRLKGEPPTSYVEEKILKQEASSQGVAQARVKEETAGSDFEETFWTVSPAVAHELSQDTATLSVESTITNDGGLLKIAGTDVQLIVPAGAFKEDRSECLIILSIIPPGRHDEASTSFCSNSSTIVELLPNNLTLKLPVQVTLPHCLQLKKGTQNKVKIFMSHHEGDAQPRWEEVLDHRYILNDKNCTIWMKRFCWTKYEIDDEIVEAKRIQIYTAAKPVYVPDDIAAIQVGYHLDLPGSGEVLRQNPNFIVDQRMPYLFLREGKHPLKVFLTTISPKTWTYLTPEDNPQVVTTQNQPLGIHSKAEVLHQENVTTQAEEEAVSSERLKESPQDASFQLPLANPFDTPDQALRRKLSLQESQHERDRYTERNLKTFRQPHEACQNVFQTHGQMSPYHEYQMLPRSGLATPVPTNPFIQQNYYHQNFSISPYGGAPFLGGQSLYEFPDNVNRGGVTLGYSLMKALGRKLDPDDALGNNWKELADKLSFTMEDIGVFELAPSPTIAVIECAKRSGKLQSIGHLKTILEQIGRTDASSLLTLPTPQDESRN